VEWTLRWIRYETCATAKLAPQACCISTSKRAFFAWGFISAPFLKRELKMEPMGKWSARVAKLLWIFSLWPYNYYPASVISAWRTTKTNLNFLNGINSIAHNWVPRHTSSLHKLKLHLSNTNPPHIYVCKYNKFTELRSSTYHAVPVSSSEI
jgi:hypothetical protein